MGVLHEIMLLNVPSTSARTILNNNDLNIVKFNAPAVSCFLPFFIFFIIIGEVGLSPWYCSHFWPIVQTPDDR
jgi:hypothetical protein